MNDTTDTRTRYSAEYMYPGVMFPEEIYRDISAPTYEAAVAEGPDETGYFKKDHWFAVKIRLITEKRFVASDGSGEETWIRAGVPGVLSIIVGRKVHVDDEEIAGDEHDILRSNIRSNSEDGYAVKTRLGNWQIASDYDLVVPE